MNGSTQMLHLTSNSRSPTLRTEYKSCRSMTACTSPSAKGVTWGAVGSLDHFLLGFVTFRYASAFISAALRDACMVRALAFFVIVPVAFIGMV